MEEGEREERGEEGDDMDVWVDEEGMGGQILMSMS